MPVEYPRKGVFGPIPFETQCRYLFDQIWKETPELTWQQEDFRVYRVKSSSKFRIVMDCAKQYQLILPRAVFVAGFIQHQCDSLWIVDSTAGNILEAAPEFLQHYDQEFEAHRQAAEQDINGPNLTFTLNSIEIMVDDFYRYEFRAEIVAHIKAIWSINRETQVIQQAYPFEHLLIEPDKTNVVKLCSIVGPITFKQVTLEQGYITKLDVSNHNCAGGIPPIVFEFRHLQELVLNNCLLTTLPQTLEGLALKKISLLENRFTTPPPILTRIPTLTSIKISSDRWLPEYKLIQVRSDLWPDVEEYDCFLDLCRLAEKDLLASKKFEQVLAIYEHFIQRAGGSQDPTPLKIESWKVFADHLFEEKKYAEAGAAFTPVVNWLLQKGGYPGQVRMELITGRSLPKEEERLAMLRLGMIPQPAPEEPKETLPKEADALDGLRQIFKQGIHEEKTEKETGYGYFIQENGHVTHLFLNGLFTLHKRDIHKFLTCLATFQQLEIFHFEGKAVVLPLPVRHLQKLKRVECSLQEYVRLEFLGPSSSVETLSVKGDNFYIPTRSIANLQGLKSLSLETKTPVSLPDLSGLHDLVSFSLDGPYTSIPDFLLHKAPVKTLSLNLPMSIFPEELTDLPALEQLTWHARNDTLPESIGKLKSLKKLVIQGSSIKTLPATIGDLHALQTLEVDTAIIFSKIPSAIEKCTELTEISFKHLNLVELPGEIGNLPKLRKLNLYDNHFASLPESFGKLTNLEELVLMANKLESLPATLEHLVALRYVDLEKNKLEEIPSFLWKIPGIVKLANNPIKEGLAAFLNRRYPVRAMKMSIPDFIRQFKVTMNIAELNTPIETRDIGNFFSQQKYDLPVRFAVNYTYYTILDNLGPGITGVQQISSGVSYLGFFACGDEVEQCPLFMVLYWDGLAFQPYIPVKGNMYNLKTARPWTEDSCDWAKYRDDFKVDLLRQELEWALQPV